MCIKNNIVMFNQGNCSYVEPFSCRPGLATTFIFNRTIISKDLFLWYIFLENVIRLVCGIIISILFFKKWLKKCQLGRIVQTSSDYNAVNNNLTNF